MRLLVDLRSHLAESPEVIQVQRVPSEGGSGREVVNGRFVIPMPPDVSFPVTAADYILDGSGNLDGGDVISRGYAHLLARFPQYDNIYFNPLLTSDHVGELVTEPAGSDPSEYFVDASVDPPQVCHPRFQTGRAEGLSDDGQMPTHTALLPVNNTVTPARPGIILTGQIQIGPHTLDCDGNPQGASGFMVYWKLYKFTVTDDVAADAGALAGQNSPAQRMLEETDPEPSGFSVYLSADQGATWHQTHLLEPISLCDKTMDVLLAFRNDTAEKLFLASYALMF